MKLSVCHQLLSPLFLLFYCHCLVAVHGKVNADNQRSIYKTNRRFKAVRSNLNVNNERLKDHFLTPNSSQADFPCPSSAVIAPCTCYVDSYLDDLIRFDCTFVESVDQLVAVFQQDFPVKELYRFEMANNSAVNWFPSFMNGITFESVVLYPGPFILEDISENFLLDQKDTLREFFISNSKLSTDSFPFIDLPSMNQLVTLDFRYSDINWIPQVQSPKLAYFNIEHSPVELLVNGSLPIGAYSVFISVKHNHIHTIEEGSLFFTDQNSANVNKSLLIDLSNNQLQSFKAGTFPLRNSQMIIHLPFNQISSFEPGTFVLPASTDLLALDLDLSFNEMTTVDEAAFRSVMPFMRILRLRENPLICDCDIAWLTVNEGFLERVDGFAMCSDGTYLHDVDLSFC